MPFRRRTGNAAFLETWLRSKLFRVSGLDAREISDKIMTELPRRAEISCES